MLWVFVVDVCARVDPIVWFWFGTWCFERGHRLWWLRFLGLDGFFCCFGRMGQGKDGYVMSCCCNMLGRGENQGVYCQ